MHACRLSSQWKRKASAIREAVAGAAKWVHALLAISYESITEPMSMKGVFVDHEV